MYVLRALVPYSRQNVLLNYKPRQFFKELEHISGYSEPVLKTALWRARQSDLVSDDPIPQLTRRGLQKVEPFVARKLGSNAQLMVIFDIPEVRAGTRRQLRTLLRNLGFKQVQLSVWITVYDHTTTVREAIRSLGLEQDVQLYEAAPVSL